MNKDQIPMNQVQNDQVKEDHVQKDQVQSPHQFLGAHIQRFTPPHSASGGKVIRAGVHIYICIYMFVDKKKFESYFSDRLTFSNIRSRTSCRIYRLALPLRAPETLSSFRKSRISILNAHLTLFVRRMTSHNSIGKYRHVVN